MRKGDKSARKKKKRMQGGELKGSYCEKRFVCDKEKNGIFYGQDCSLEDLTRPLLETSRKCAK